MENAPRRSTRIMYSIPVTVRGVDEAGAAFEAAGRTIMLNRHGARVQIACPLNPGQTIRVLNQTNDAEADFRVVGPLAPPLDRVGEWGIACLSVDANIWDIYFPPTPEDSDAHFVLACGHCQSLALQALSLMDVEVLETAGLLTKRCVYCGKSTPWGYPQPASEPGTGSDPAAGTAAIRGDPALLTENRKWARKPAQIPIRVRDYFGEMEFARTENISRDGFCFSSPRKYLVGQGLVVICPFDASVERPEACARIVRIKPGSGRARNIYGVRYEPSRL